MIERTLQVLVGLPMFDCGRAADLQWFHFGERHTVVVDRGPRKGTTKVVGDHALHVQCAWRLGGPDGIIAASGDLFRPTGDPFTPPPDWNWERDNRRDERLGAWLAATAGAVPIVTAVTADIYGGLHLQLTGDHHLAVLPDESTSAEHWRFFQPSHDTDHFVVTGTGINDDYE